MRGKSAATPIVMEEPLMDFFEKEMRAESHRGFVGMQMFCPNCNGVLDCRKSVAVDLLKDSKPIWSKIVCLKCYDHSGLLAKMAVILAKNPGHKVEIYNGKTQELTRL